ncbi:MULTISPECIES: hypothetical protein [unclassified Sporosarcina]|nr:MULTISPECIES: hypothetical protein [unclassified Sporosarcina]
MYLCIELLLQTGNERLRWMYERLSWDIERLMQWYERLTNG